MTDTTERAELLADREAFIDAHHKHLDLTEINDAWGRPMFRHSHVEAMWDGWKKGRAALRRLAAQDQEPMAHPYVKNIDGSPLYLSPPPAAGWDEAIEAATRICHEAAAETDGNASRGAMAEELASSIESLRATPAATKSADAGGGWRSLSEDTSWIDGRDVVLLARDMEVQARYCPGEWSDETPNSPREYSGAVWSCFDDEFQLEIEECSHDPSEWGHDGATHWRPVAALSHQPGPSDRTADVTVDELAMKIAKARIHSRKSTYIARALLDAFTVGRR